MTARTYTIPACNVVEGMLLYNVVGGAWWSVDSVTVGDHLVEYSQRAHDGQPSGGMVGLDTLVKVTLPGPSPRDTEENGGVCTCGAGAMGKHAKGCPADGLRLWPVGATWSPYEHGTAIEGWWAVSCAPTAVLVPLCNVRDGFAYYDPGIASALRAAFCEPEVQP